jgi:hypothetical protein
MTHPNDFVLEKLPEESRPEKNEDAFDFIKLKE